MARQSIYKRARHTVDKQKKKVILQYMQENPDLVINSSITVIKGLKFRLRLKFALDIIRGNSRKKRMEAYMVKEDAPEKEAPTQEKEKAGLADIPERHPDTECGKCGEGSPKHCGAGVKGCENCR
jgi:hypothetical protein